MDTDSPSSHPSLHILHSPSLSRPLSFRLALISLPSHPSYIPWSHSVISSSSLTFSLSRPISESLNSRLNVCCARFLGLTKTCTTRAGSMSFPEPMRWDAVPSTCFTPSAVSSSSVEPVYRPFLVHSVSPEPCYQICEVQIRGEAATMSSDENAGCRSVKVRHFW